jgi:hypothetical protein
MRNKMQYKSGNLLGVYEEGNEIVQVPGFWVTEE